MHDSARHALPSGGFLPHGHCYLWRPDLVGLHVLADLLIGLAYVAISLTLLYMVRRIRVLPFNWVYLAFGLFIISCGATHFMEVYTLWVPAYWLSGAVKAATAVSSVGTAVLLPPLVPRIVAFIRSDRLARDEASFRMMAEAMPQLVWSARGDGEVDYLSPTWTGFTGISQDRSLGWQWQAAIHPDDLGRVMQAWRHSLATGERFEVEMRLRDQQGGFRWFLSRGVPFRDDDGHVYKWVGTCTDIDAQKQAIQVRDDFLSIASHELRTPLTALQLQVGSTLRQNDKAVENDVLPEWAKAKVRSIARSTGRITKLVNELLDVSRITSGHIRLAPESTDLAAVIRDVVGRITSDTVPPPRIVTVGCDGAVTGTWDRLRLEQVIVNLVTNAVKYGDGQPVTVTLTHDDSQVAVAVEDRGIGISAEDQRRIFDRFERSVSVRHYGGFGLGLWIVREIVRGHGGTITVDSELGRGSIFTVHLPRQFAGAQAAPPPAPEQPR